MEEKPEIGLMDRFKSYFRKKPITPSDQVDAYITQKLPEFIDEYKLARRDDLEGVDTRIDTFTEEIKDLKDWKKETRERVRTAKKKIDKMENRLEKEED